MVGSLETVLSELVGDVVTPTGVSHLSEHIAERLAAAGWHLARPDSLDAAWAEAEAALPEGWLLVLNRHKDGTALASTRSTAYRAGKGEIGVLQRLAVLQGPFGGSADASGPTPVVALHALVAKLREKSRSGLTTTATIPPT